MASTNIIFSGFDSPVVLNITGIKDADGNDITLADLTKVTATFGSDSRNSVDDSTSVVVSDATTLRLFFGDTTESHERYWVISGEYAGKSYILSNACKNNLGTTTVCN